MHGHLGDKEPEDRIETRVNAWQREKKTEEEYFFEGWGLLISKGDVVSGEHAWLPFTDALPPVGVGIVDDLDEITSTETQLTLFLWLEIKES